MEISADKKIQEELKHCWEKGKKGFFLLKSLEKEEIFIVYMDLLESLLNEDSYKSSHRCRQLFFLLAAETENKSEKMVGDAWQNYILNYLIKDSNPFSEKASYASYSSLGAALKKAFQEDLRQLEELYNLNGKKISLAIERLLYDNRDDIIEIDALNTRPPDNGRIPSGAERFQLKEHLSQLKGWEGADKTLADYFHQYGVGFWGDYWAFRWEATGSNNGYLKGVPYPDYVLDKDLVGYEKQRQQIWENTEYLLTGYPANNILLYGERGTGKSSTVKSLLNRFGPRGLRIIEVSKRFFSYFPDIFKLLRDKPQKFILFIDDLSFEEEEVSYKELKGLLEGGLERKPQNVVVYATSNRRHLVREFFHDQEDVTGSKKEIRTGDTVQEKLSLADRFGITVIFPLPGQEEYLEMVEKMAEQRNLKIPGHVLREKALAWEKWQNAPSGRTARQFVDYMAGSVKGKK